MVPKIEPLVNTRQVLHHWASTQASFYFVL